VSDSPGEPEGCLVIDKPAGWTSHDVVARVRRLLSTRRVGHAGTLDPDATGVLVLGVGRATRLLRFATLLHKTYVGEVVLGTATTTLDAAGQICAEADMSGVSLDEVRQAALSLTGRIEQVPPMVSAVKVGGRRLHELAREGKEVERAARLVEVRRFDVFPTGSPGVVRILVECSSGTYVRVLAADLGQRLGGVAHLGSLRRLSVGSFGDDEAITLDEVSVGALRPCLDLVRDLARAEASAELVSALGHGRLVDRVSLGAAGEGPWAVVGPDGSLAAVCLAHGVERVQPVVVLAPTS
jgi:tRNA pseudouridine55 synthase